jgi:DNA polymerase-1
MVLLADCETNGLLDAMDRLWTLQLGEEDGDEVYIYADQPGFRPLAEGLERLRKAEKVVWHNGIGFDHHAINMVYPGTLREDQMVDTLVMARLALPEERSHSLDEWGKRLGEFKGKYGGDFQTFDEELVIYARQDIVVLRKLYKHLKKLLDGWGASVDLEHEVAWALNKQERNGFCFDVKAAELLYAELRGEASELEAELKTIFPPIERSETRIAGANNKTLGRRKGEPYTKTWFDEFNPGSRQQIAERLQLLGWKPTEYGKDGYPTVDEATLAKLKYPEVQLILKYFALSKKIGMLAEGKAGWLKMVKKTGRIHGRVNPNGACTGRMSHSSPNVAQVDKDPRMRRLWIPRVGWVLMGCDAEGLEARMLGHYLARYDGGSFSDRVVNGDKKVGTDVHSVNMKAIHKLGWLIDRDGAKTLLYALMYGAGDFKLATTVRENLRELGQPNPKIPQKEMGLMIRRALIGAMQGLGKLVDAIKAAYKSKGYIVGLDGRHVVLRSDHSALNTLLQGAGAIVMKQALVLFMRRHGDLHGTMFGLCANVHDEIQAECVPEIAAQLGQSFADCIEEAGKSLGVRCPLAGAFDVGASWAETH